MRSYSELIQLKTFMDRYRYLKINGRVGDVTFGAERYFNQIFYNSSEWKRVRRDVIIRDNSCDLGIPDREFGPKELVFVHHMNPITVRQIEDFDPKLMDPEYLISCSFSTHNAIHYGDENLLLEDYVERKPYDTVPWRQNL